MTDGAKARAGFSDPPVKYTPINSAMKRESLMPTGATKMALVFWTNDQLHVVLRY